MPPHLLLIANPQKKEYFTETLHTLGATCHVVHTLEDLGRTPSHSQFHGMVIDLHSYFRIPQKERAYFHEKTLVLPTLKIYADQHKKTVIVHKANQNGNHVRNLHEFIGKCSATVPRAIRRAQRHKLFFNVQLEKHTSNTTDISRSGCFILTTDESYTTGDEQFILIRFMELSDQTPIPCKIMRRVSWGNNFVPAGIGVDFISMTESQRHELDEIFAGSTKSKEHAIAVNNDSAHITATA